MNQHLRDLLSETQILQIASDIGAGLAYMHYIEPRLIHRDLKIENVLISSDGVFKLCDFGSVSPVLRPPRNAQEFQILEHDIQNRTTMQYRSPEMVDLTRGFPIDEKSDIWAFGVFVYKLCYYTTPFEKEGDPAILSAKYTFPSKPAFSDRLKRLISICLSEDPRNRLNVYQVLKEIYDMRGMTLPLKDIYVSPTSTQKITQTAPVESSSPASSIPLANKSDSNVLNISASASASRTNINIPSSLSSTNLPLPLEQQQPIVSATSTQQRQTPTDNPKHRYLQGISSNANSSTLSNDPFGPISGAATPAAKSDVEDELQFDTAEDVASKFPTIEELTLSLEKQSFSQTLQNKSTNTYSKSSSRVNLSSGPLPQSSNVVVSPPTSTSSYASSSPWNIPTSSSVNQNSLNSVGGSYPPSTSVNDFGYTQGMSSVQPTKPLSQVHQQQQVPSYVSQPAQSSLRPQMVSRSTMTSPIASRSHTPAAPHHSKSSPVLNSQNPPQRPIIRSISPRDGGDSSSDEDDPVVDGTRSVGTIQAKYTHPKPKGFTRHDDGTLKNTNNESFTNSDNTLLAPIPRKSDERQHSRPLSMFVHNSNSESLIDTSPDYQPRSRTMKRVASRSNPQLRSPVPKQPDVVLIEPLITDEKDKLKSLLTGLNEKSNTVVLDDNDDEYIDNSVDFLKVLNNESTGRSRHNRSPSGGSMMREEPTGLYPSTSNSGTRKVGSHTKKASVSLKHAVSTKIGDAFKKFDGSRATSYSRNDQSRTGQFSNMKNKFSYSSENLGTYESDPEDFDYPSKRDKLAPAAGLSRNKTTRVPSSSGSRAGGTVQGRVHAFMNLRSEAPPPKTASGYGKYTDRSSPINDRDASDEGFGSPIFPSRSYSAMQSDSVHRGRSSAEFSSNDNNEQGRKSFESALRNSEKIKKMASTPVTMSLSQKSSPNSHNGSHTASPDAGEAKMDHHHHHHHHHHHFSRHHRDTESYEPRSQPRYRDDPDSDSSGDYGDSLPSRNTISKSSKRVPSKQSQTQYGFNSHRRQLSTISSASSSTEGSFSANHTGPRKPPSKPSKPAHLQSPRRQDSPATGSDGEGKFTRGSLRALSAIKTKNTVNQTDTGNNSNLIEMSPAQSPITASNDDWKEMFNNKYPNVV